MMATSSSSARYPAYNEQLPSFSAMFPTDNAHWQYIAQSNLGHGSVPIRHHAAEANFQEPLFQHSHQPQLQLGQYHHNHSNAYHQPQGQQPGNQYRGHYAAHPQVPSRAWEGYYYPQQPQTHHQFKSAPMSQGPASYNADWSQHNFVSTPMNGTYGAYNGGEALDLNQMNYNQNAISSMNDSYEQTNGHIHYESASSDSTTSPTSLTGNFTNVNGSNYPPGKSPSPSNSSGYNSSSHDYQPSARASTRLVARNSRESSSPQAPVINASVQSSGYKRASSSPEEGAPKPKKVRKTPNANTNAKKAPKSKGFSTAKRNERMLITEENAKLKGHLFVSKDDPNRPLHLELQVSRCMTNAYKCPELKQCLACVARGKGDVCRFQGVRCIYRDMDGNIVGVAFAEFPIRREAPPLELPLLFNEEAKPERVKKVKVAIANALVNVMRGELQHIEAQENLKNTMVYRDRETECRATCDACLTSIFSSSWMCRECGRECCNECFQTLNATFVPENSDIPADELLMKQNTRSQLSASRPRLVTCSKGKEHSSPAFVAVTRFRKDALQRIVGEMQTLVDEDRPPMSHEEISHLPIQTAAVGPETFSEPLPPLSEPNYSRASSPLSEAPSEEEETPGLEIPTFHVNELEEETFVDLWANGRPMLVKGLKERLKVPWTPEYFKETYGDRQCCLVECQEDKNQRGTVGTFFDMFLEPREEGKSWKLKDWPPTTDFKNEFPELFEDFMNAVPMPSYVRRDGIMNIASHFAVNAVAPDLGPKMYNAQGNFTGAGSKGSTRLHMDMADAVNIMPFAADDEDGNQGGAVWDLFRPEDSEKIRGYMSSKFPERRVSDPIHGQQFYLDDELRHDLYKTTGVKSYHLIQRPGEAVFIPAGSAHQVCNLTACIKVAIDFVSPENINRCEQLTKEFRDVNQRLAWKEDVLQLRTMMWFAWLSCCNIESKAGPSGSVVSGGSDNGEISAADVAP